MYEDRFRSPDEIYCYSCGSKIRKDVQFCPNCSAKMENSFGSNSPSSRSPSSDRFGNPSTSQNPSAKGVSEDWLLVLLLCCFLGTFGIHRFYVGKIGTGVLMLLTGGGCGLWTIYDIIIIATGKFSKLNGELISRNP